MAEAEVFHSEENKQCTLCHDVGKNKKKCSRCKTAVYCDKECQKRDWKSHKAFCNSAHKDIPKEKWGIYQGPKAATWDQRDKHKQYVHERVKQRCGDGDAPPHCVICGDTEDQQGITLRRLNTGEVLCNECMDIQGNYEEKMQEYSGIRGRDVSDPRTIPNRMELLRDNMDILDADANK